MTQKPKDFNAYFDFQKRAMAPFLDLNEFAVRTFERAARHGYEAAGEALEFSIAQAKAALTAKDPQQFAAKQAQAKLKAPSVKPGKYDLVLDPSHTWLTIHECVGHPLELDRILGDERNFAGTSFVSMDMVEVSPPFDHAEITSLAASALVMEYICLKAWQKGARA